MILAQSRQQLLNGNKLMLFLFSIILLITSCGAGKRLPGDKSKKKDAEIVEINVKRDSVAKYTIPVDILDMDDAKPSIPEINIEKESIINTKIDSFVTGIDNNIKNDYRIAVVLPFMLNQIPISGVYVDDSSKQLLPDSKKAMDFYLGCKLAKEENESYNKNVNVYFVDDKNSSDELNTLMQSPVLKNADYIVAPFNATQVKLLSEFAKQNQKPLFSPITNSIYSVKNNPFFYSVTPSLYAQYQYIIQTIQQNQLNQKIEIIYDDADTVSEKIAFLKNIIEQNSTYPNTSIDYVTYNLKSSDNIAQKLYTTDTISKRNIVILSSNELYIKNVINKLASIKNPLDIYANSKIKFSKSLITAKNFKHNLYTIYAYNTNTDTKLFNQKYQDNFVKEPTELSYLGYDLLQFLLMRIENNKSFLEKDDLSYSTYLQSDFNFIPSISNSKSIDYYDNLSLKLYKWNSGAFIKNE
ncbi:MAG: amino acid ABC transporter substrate-binding protein [Sphingobacteriales bacterium]|jgi:hypothetical protein|nr:MAG: amino acid ABC transporter substrate-binding protein [Sphingobacteriales bacterium]